MTEVRAAELISSGSSIDSGVVITLADSSTLAVGRAQLALESLAPLPQLAALNQSDRSNDAALVQAHLEIGNVLVDTDQTDLSDTFTVSATYSARRGVTREAGAGLIRLFRVVGGSTIRFVEHHTLAGSFASVSQLQAMGDGRSPLRQGVRQLDTDSMSLASFSRLSDAHRAERQLGGVEDADVDAADIGRHVAAALLTNYGELTSVPATLMRTLRVADGSTADRVEISRMYLRGSKPVARVTTRSELGDHTPVHHVRIETPALPTVKRPIASFSVEFEIRDGAAIVVGSGLHGHPLDRS
jgi:hypothetical protein